MTIAGIDLNLLVAFDALYAERSVTKAARRLGLGQPAMSAALGRLRHALADELFVRGSDGMLPTPKAMRIAPSIIAAISELRRTFDIEIPFEPATANRIFTVASTDYTTLILLPALMCRLRQYAPDVCLRVVGYDKQALPEMLDRAEIDIAFGVFPDLPDRFVATPLFEEHFVGVMRTGHPALERGAPDLRTFLDLPHALVTLKRDARGAVDEALDRLGLSRQIILTLPHILALPATLLCSDLVASMPQRVIQRWSEPALTTFDLPLSMPPWTVSMLWSPHARSDQASAWIRRQIVEVAAVL